MALREAVGKDGVLVASPTVGRMVGPTEGIYQGLASLGAVSKDVTGVPMMAC